MKDDGFSSLKNRLRKFSHSDTDLGWERLRHQLPGAVPPPVRIRWMWRTTMTALSGVIAATVAVVVLTKTPHPSATTSTPTVETSEDPELLENLDLMLQLEDHLEEMSEKPTKEVSPTDSSMEPGAEVPSIRRFYALRS